MRDDMVHVLWTEGTISNDKWYLVKVNVNKVNKEEKLSDLRYSPTLGKEIKKVTE